MDADFIDHQQELADLREIERLKSALAASQAECEELRKALNGARAIIVLGMDSMEWGAAVGAMLEDPDVKAAYAAVRQARGKGE